MEQRKIRKTRRIQHKEEITGRRRGGSIGWR
jgi:hypothetical protein